MRISVLGFRSDLRIELQAPVPSQSKVNWPKRLSGTKRPHPRIWKRSGYIVIGSIRLSEHVHGTSWGYAICTTMFMEVRLGQLGVMGLKCICWVNLLG